MYMRRCHSALIGPIEQELDDHFSWILTTRENLARESNPSKPREVPLKIRLSEHKVTEMQLVNLGSLKGMQYLILTRITNLVISCSNNSS